MDDTILYGIDYILFATGFRYTYPFLPDYHNPSLGRQGEAPADAQQPIVTDGSHIRSLHLDTFYIDNPTLAFVNCTSDDSLIVWCENCHWIVRRQFRNINFHLQRVPVIRNLYGVGREGSFTEQRRDVAFVSRESWNHWIRKVFFLSWESRRACVSSSIN